MNNGANVYAEYEGDGNSIRLKSKRLSGLGPDLVLGFTEYDVGDNAETRWVLQEGPGNVIQVLDASGKVLDDHLTNAWGENILISSSSTDGLYGFAGR